MNFACKVFQALLKILQLFNTGDLRHPFNTVAVYLRDDRWGMD